MRSVGQKMRGVPCILSRRAAGLLLVALLGAAVEPALAEQPATATVRATLEKASRITAGDKTHDEELAAVRDVARQLVDTRSMGRRALGAAFTTLTPVQQEEFLRLFDDLFVRSYLQKLLLFHDPKFRFGAEAKRDEAVIVSTEVVTPKDAYAVTYEMRPEGDRWQATDIVVEGVSMTSSYADQFASLLRDRSFDELLDLMRRKVDHFRGTEAK